jgi:hypothetical protein
MRRLTEMFGDDDAVIDELLAVFQQSLRPLRERLKREVLGRGSELKAITHELRGAAANVGAPPWRNSPAAWKTWCPRQLERDRVASGPRRPRIRPHRRALSPDTRNAENMRS